MRSALTFPTTRLRCSLPLRAGRLLLLLLALSLAGALLPARAQLGSVGPSAPLAAGERANAFVAWNGGAPIEGFAFDLPEGWRLEAIRAVHDGSGNALSLRLVESRRRANRVFAYGAEPLRGRYEIIATLEVGERTGAATLTLAPVTRRDEDGQRIVRNSRGVDWTVPVTRSRPSGSNKALRPGRATAPILLDRRALPALEARAPYTVEGWIRTTGLGEVVLSTWDGQSYQPYPLEWLVDERGRLIVYRGEPGSHLGMRTHTPIADGRWHHIAVVNDPERDRARLLLDGSPVDSLRLTRTSSDSNTLPLALGTRQTASGGQEAAAFTGLLDELRLWDHARTPDAVRLTLRQQLDEPRGGLVRLGFDTPISTLLLVRAPSGSPYAASDLSFSYPVEALDAAFDEAAVRLTWQTKDRDNERFVIERSTDGRDYEPVGAVRREDRIAEAADGTMRYAFTDIPPESPLLYYRVRQRFAEAPDRLSAALKLGLGAQDTQFAVIEGNSPNPFVGSTTILFELGEAAPVRLSVWDISGSRVAVLVDRTLSAGRHEVRFEATDLPSGVYFVRLQTPEARLTHKMTLAR